MSRFVSPILRVVAVLYLGLFINLMLSQRAHAALPVESWTTANGARVLFMASSSIPMFDVNIDFDAGTRLDPAGKSGLAALTASLLDKGVRMPDGTTLDEGRIADAFADVGAAFSANASLDRTSVRLRSLSAPVAREPALAMLAQLLSAPSFPDAVIERERQRSIAALREALTRPDVLASRAFNGALFGKHSYGVAPTEVGLQSISRNDVAAFHARRYGMRNAVVTLIGALSRTEAQAIAEQLTAERNGDADDKRAVLPPVEPLGEPSEIRISHPAQQAHVLIGQPAIARGDPDYFPLLVGNYILGGGGFVSRLMSEVREKRGLVYGVQSYFIPMLQPGPFEISLQTQKAQADQAIGVVRDTIAAFLRDGPSEAELKAAKDNLINGFPLRIDNNRKLLDNLAVIGWYGLPLDYLDTWTQRIAAVSLADIRRAFGKHVRPAQMATVIVGAQ